MRQARVRNDADAVADVVSWFVLVFALVSYRFCIVLCHSGTNDATALLQLGCCWRWRRCRCWRCWCWGRTLRNVDCLPTSFIRAARLVCAGRPMRPSSGLGRSSPFSVLSLVLSHSSVSAQSQSQRSVAVSVQSVSQFSLFLRSVSVTVAVSVQSLFQCCSQCCSQFCSQCCSQFCSQS